MEQVSAVVPARAGTQRSTGKVFPTWHRFRGALAQVLCLADPWIPAFAGMTSEETSDPWVPASAGTTFEL